MKQILLVATTIAAMLSFSSCKKENNNPSPDNTGNSKLLKKITRTENGTTTVFNCTYNAAKKLTSYSSTDNSEYIHFTYDVNGNLTGVEQKDSEFKNMYAYTYVNNIPVSATFKSWEIANGQQGDLFEDDKLTYTVTNNQISKIKLEMLLDASEINLLLTYTNGSLSTIESETPNLYKATITYGNKKAALPKVTNWMLDQAGFILQFGANNDIRSITWDFPGNAGDKTVTTNYTYDNAGYVLTSNDGAIQMVYEYQ